MARCCNDTDCSCVITAGDGTTVTGLGTVADPYVIGSTVASDVVADLAKKATPVSTDGSFSLPPPTGVGFEFIITANVLEDIQMNGSSL